MNKLSGSTPLTTALALSLCAGAFWTGTVATKVSHLEQYTAHDAEEDRQLLKISQELTNIARDNSRRIEWLEKQARN